MKRITLSILVLLTWGISLTAQITRTQADVIVFQHIQNEVTTPYKLYVYNHAPSVDEMIITTYNDEKIKIKYACWVYYLNENPETTTPCQHRYLFVKENDGNLLEIITSNDLGQEDLTDWQRVLGVTDREKEQNILLYPNPTTGELQVTSYELQVTGIEIFDVYGKKLSSNHLINISHLPAGAYFVKIKTETGEVTQKIIKN